MTIEIWRLFLFDYGVLIGYISKFPNLIRLKIQAFGDGYSRQNLNIISLVQNAGHKLEELDISILDCCCYILAEGDDNTSISLKRLSLNTSDIISSNIVESIASKFNGLESLCQGTWDSSR